MHIDSSIIDKVKKDTDREITDIENESSKQSISQNKEKQSVEESSSDEEPEMTEQEKLYGKAEKPHKSKH